MNPLSLFLLTFLRFAGLFMVAPMFAGKFVPIRYRVLLALAISGVVGSSQLPLALAADAPEWSSAAFLAAAGSEAFLGVVMGTSVLLFFVALQVAGGAFAYVSGISFPVDAGLSNEAASLFSNFLFLLGVAILFLTNGHHQIIEALLVSFQHFPPGTFVASPDLLQSTFEIFYLGFVLGVRIALPVVAVLLLSQFGLAILSRVLPQLNVFALSFAVNALLVLAILTLSLGAGLWLFEEQFRALPMPMLWQ